MSTQRNSDVHPDHTLHACCPANKKTAAQRRKHHTPTVQRGWDVKEVVLYRVYQWLQMCIVCNYHLTVWGDADSLKALDRGSSVDVSELHCVYRCLLQHHSAPSCEARGCIKSVFKSGCCFRQTLYTNTGSQTQLCLTLCGSNWHEVVESIVWRQFVFLHSFTFLFTACQQKCTN